MKAGKHLLNKAWFNEEEMCNTFLRFRAAACRNQDIKAVGDLSVKSWRIQIQITKGCKSVNKHFKRLFCRLLVIIKLRYATWSSMLPSSVYLKQCRPNQTLLPLGKLQTDEASDYSKRETNNHARLLLSFWFSFFFVEICYSYITGI